MSNIITDFNQRKSLDRQYASYKDDLAALADSVSWVNDPDTAIANNNVALASLAQAYNCKGDITKVIPGLITGREEVVPVAGVPIPFHCDGESLGANNTYVYGENAAAVNDLIAKSQLLAYYKANQASVMTDLTNKTNALHAMMADNRSAYNTLVTQRPALEDRSKKSKTAKTIIIVLVVILIGWFVWKAVRRAA